MSRPPLPIFLERQSYRRRRLGDAAKLIPILGILLFLLPILWAGDARTSGGLVYLFAIWGALIVAMAVISRRLMQAEPDADEVGSEDGEASTPPGGR